MFDSLVPSRASRRVTRRRLVLGAVAGLGSLVAYRWWRRIPGRLVARRHRYLTPNRDFYRVSIGGVPDFDEAAWRLRVAGPAGVREISPAELARLPKRTVTQTFMCISNPVGGSDIGNAEWTVTPLAPLLEEVTGTQRDGLRTLFRGMDGFESAVPLEVALDPAAALAWEMNGRPLPPSHGRPVRVLLPGRYGMKQPKWLASIEVGAGRVTGYWERRGWSKTARVRIWSRIDRIDGPAGRRVIRGVAYCGARPVARVEVSIDRGSWRAARLASPAGGNAWATWEAPLEPVGGDGSLVAVRAVDDQGRSQQESFSMTFPSGATGLHRVYAPEA